MNCFVQKVLLYLIVGSFCVISSTDVRGQDKKEEPKSPEPFKSEYLNYTPDFVKKVTEVYRWNYTEKEMERSSEIKFYTFNEVEEVKRANA